MQGEAGSVCLGWTHCHSSCSLGVTGEGGVPKALVLSGDGDPDTMGPTCQSLMVWKLAHWGWVGETTSLLAEGGVNALLHPGSNTLLCWLGLALPDHHSSWRQGPGGLGWAVRAGWMARGTKNFQAGRGRNSKTSTTEGPRSLNLRLRTAQYRHCPKTLTCQGLR